MEPYLPIPFRAGNTVIRKYNEVQQDTNFNRNLVTLVDWKDVKGRIHERHTMFVKKLDVISQDSCIDLYKSCYAIYSETSNAKAGVKEINDNMAKKLVEEFGFSLPEKEFYITVGIYPNLYCCNRLTPQGMYKWNYVHRDHIYTHLLYNIIYRPGRTFFIDNVCYNNGMGKDKGFLAALQYCHDLTERIKQDPPTRETTPYR